MQTKPVLKYWVIGVLGISLSALLFYFVNDKRIQKRNTEIDYAISKSEIKIIDELQKIDLVIESMAFFFENTKEVSPETFEKFTNPFKDDLNGIKALEWAPLIPEGEKKEFISDISKSYGFTSNQISAYANLDMPEKKLWSYPIALLNPIQNLEGILGYDLYSEHIRKAAIQKATSSRKIAFSGPINLIHDDNGVPGILAMKSVFEDDGESVKGVVAVVYRMDQFLQKTLEDEVKVLDVVIKDREADNEILYSSISKIEALEKMKASVNVIAANRTWNIGFYPKNEVGKFSHTPESYFILILGLIITGLFIINLVSRDNRSKILAQKVLQRTNELEVSNRQKENLLREVHHRVMNNLQITSSLMNLQKRKLQDEEAIYALTSSQDRINAIALIHKKIYQHDGVDAVDLKGYLENLIKSHKRISPSVKYVIDCPEVFIDLDTAVPLAIITSEIVINALKHAFPKQDESNFLYLLVTPMKDDVIDIVISDNGIGMPEKKRGKKQSGLGHDVIKKLCRQLQATYEFSSSNSGTAFSMRFKQRKLQIPVFSEVPA